MTSILATAIGGVNLYSARLDRAAQTLTQSPLHADETTPSIEDAIVEMGISEIGYKANAKVIKAQKRLDDELMNIIT